MQHFNTRSRIHAITAFLAIAIITLTNACSTTPSRMDARKDAQMPAGVIAGGTRTADAEPGLGAARRAAPAAAPTLYDQLGGASGVEQLTTDFIRELAADERVRGRYRDTDIGRFHTMMKQQMCMETGGGCEYTGDDMRRSHAGMNIGKAEFNAVVEALMSAMDKNRVPQGVQNQLLAKYATMREDIIEH